MSLEKAIADNTAAVLKLCGLIEQEITANAAVRDVIAGAAAQAGAVATGKNDPKPEPVVAAETKPVKETSAAETKPAIGQSIEAARALVKDTAQRVFDTKGRDELIALNQRFGVKKASELLPEQINDFLAQANKVLAGVSAADADDSPV